MKKLKRDERWHVFLMIIYIVLSTLNGGVAFFSLGSNQTVDVNNNIFEDKINALIGTIAIVTAILAGVNAFFQFPEKIESII